MKRFELFNLVEANDGIYETRKYRYCIRYREQETGYIAELVRMEKNNLDTTWVLNPDNWEIVYTVVRM